MRNLLQPLLVDAIVLLDPVVKTPQTTLSHTQQIQMNIQFGNLGKIHMTMVYDLLSTIGNYFLYFRIYFNSFSVLSRLYLFLTSSNIHVIFCSWFVCMFVRGRKKPALANFTQFIFQLIVSRKWNWIYCEQFEICFDFFCLPLVLWSVFCPPSSSLQFNEFTKNGNVFSILFRDFIPFNFTILCAFYCPFLAFLQLLFCLAFILSLSPSFYFSRFLPFLLYDYAYMCMRLSYSRVCITKRESAQ